jgi:hypothetical protein
MYVPTYVYLQAIKLWFRTDCKLCSQVVKWQNVCINIHQAFKEMVIARSLNHLKEEDFRKMSSTICSRLVRTTFFITCCYLHIGKVLKMRK